MRVYVKRTQSVAVLAAAAALVTSCSSSALAGLMANLQGGLASPKVVEATVSTVLIRQTDRESGAYSYTSKLLDFKTGSFVSALDAPALRFRRSYGCIACDQRNLKTYFQPEGTGPSSHLDVQTREAYDFEDLPVAPSLGWTELDAGREVLVDSRHTYLFRIRTGNQTRYAKVKIGEGEGEPTESDVTFDVSFRYQPDAGVTRF